MLTLRLALRELKSNRMFAFLYALSLSFGLLGLATVDSLKISIHEALDARAKFFLAADLGISARRPLKDSELAILKKNLPPGSREMDLRESFTMLASASNSRLVELRVIEPEYPYYGDILLKNQGHVTSDSPKDLFAKPNVWVYPDLLVQLGLKPGEKIKIGEGTFTISDEVLLDSAGAGSDIGFAPPVYMAARYFATTRLQQNGSAGFYTLLVNLPPKSDEEKLATELNRAITDPEVQILTPRNSSEQIGRLLNYLSDYLSLAGLVALLLASVGQIFLLRNYFLRHFRDIAILKSLGLGQNRILGLYFCQLFILSLLSILPVLIFTHFVLPAFSPLLENGLHIKMHLYLPASTAALVTAIAFFQTLALSAPLLIETAKVKVQNLFAAAANSTTHAIRLYLFAPAVLLFIILAIAMSHSLKLGAIFLGLLVLSVLVLAIFFRLIFKILSLITLHPPWSLALQHARSQAATTFAAFLAIAIAALLSNLIPQIETSIRDEVTTPPGVGQPALFLYDIQNDQFAGVQDLIKNLDAPLMESAPMVRARLAFVNGKKFVKPERMDSWSREKESENRSRNRGYNLSFSQDLTPSEEIVAGQPFTATGLGGAQISLEKKFASRMGFKIGDQLTFDVQGINVEGRVVNFRRVRWTSFQPNFFIRFNPGPLDDAPKTFLVTLGAMSSDLKNKVQLEVVRKFSNIAIIDVTRMVARILEVIGQLAVALKIMAAFAATVGLTILFFILYNQIYDRRREANLIKVLGASESFIFSIFIAEAISLTILALALGTVLSLAVNFGLSYFLFDDLFVIDWRSPAIIASSIIVVSFTITFILIKTIFEKNPSTLLHSD